MYSYRIDDSIYLAPLTAPHPYPVIKRQERLRSVTGGGGDTLDLEFGGRLSGSRVAEVRVEVKK